MNMRANLEKYMKVNMITPSKTIWKDL